MLISSASIAAVIVAIVGVVILWSNPVRMVNRTVFTCSFHVAVWLVVLHLAITAFDGLLWLKWTCAIGVWIPLHLWLVKESLVANLNIFRLQWMLRILGWIVVSSLLAIIPFSDFFIPPHSSADHRVYGWGYYVFIAVDLGLYAYLFFDTWKNLKALVGGVRLELQVWMGGGCATAVTVFALMALSAVTKDTGYIRLQPLAILVFYAGTAYAITTHRLFDARYIIKVGLHRIGLVVAVTIVAFGADAVIALWLPPVIALIATTAGALWFASELNSWLNSRLQFYPQAAQARAAAFEIARQQANVKELESAFLSVLQGWGQAEHAVILSGGPGGMKGSEIELSGDGAIFETMQALLWVTPERLVRERTTPKREELRRFLDEHKLGALVLDAGSAITVLVGVGVRASRRPFTYPQIKQLMELASIIEGAFERAHYSARIQHAQQLATVGLLGASVAHEIRNPLVTIKTFAHLLPQHHQDAAFRDRFFPLISEEVTRIDRLTEQLLGLSTPRIYTAQAVHLHPVLHATLELVAAKAEHRAVQLVEDFQANPDLVSTDPAAAKQVVLNLCLNAIQAVEGRDGDGSVQIATRLVRKGLELSVTDNGPGIAPEILPRLFQPFATTKSSGFGLGLAICSDILSSLKASISADPPVAGRGATFRVIFPCLPPTS
jgi:signal transduction histidine kinase